MKKFQSKILAVLILIYCIGCSSDKNNNPEIRFVDLQGNPRPIKTRVPEANVKIMSGQSNNYSENSSKIQNEYIANQKKISQDTYLRDRELSPQNSFTDNNPRFTDADNFKSADNNQTTSSKNNYEVENPIVEYDLSKDSSSKDTQQISKKSSSDNDLVKIETSSDNNSANDGMQSTVSKSNKLLNQKAIANNKNNIITYSNKKVKKNKKFVAPKINSEESNETAVEDSEGSDIVSTSQINTQVGGGKFYVQVGAFNNSKGARSRLNKITNFGKGKVITGYANNKRVYRSVFGPFNSKTKAENIKNQIIESGNDAIVIRSN